MKRLYFNILLMSCAWTMLSAQDKYSDIYEQLDDLQPKIAYEQLFIFQQKKPTVANLYLQVGNICEQILANIDPLRDNEFSSYWAENACLFYSIFPTYNHNDIRDNRKFYANLPIKGLQEKIKDEDVIAFQQHRLRVCQQFKEKTNEAYSHLENSKKHYNRSITLFTEINDTYQNRNEALLQTEQNLLNKIHQMSKHADSTLFYFQKYSDVLTEYPIKEYQQQILSKRIATFRLDGITNSDFYGQQIDVWDFKQWAEEFEKEYTANILPLRKEVEDVYDRYKRSINRNDSTADRPYFTNRFLLRLGRYDKNSLVRELVLALEKMRLLQNDLSQMTTAHTTEDNALTLHMRRCYRQIIMQEDALHQLKQLQQTVSEDKMASFKGFFDTHFGNKEGLMSFCLQQENEIESLTHKIMSDSLIRYMQAAGAANTEGTLRFYNEIKEETCIVTSGEEGVDIRITDEKGYAKSIYNYPQNYQPLFIADVEQGYIIVCQSMADAQKIILSVNENLTLQATPLLPTEQWHITSITRLAADEFAIWGQDAQQDIFAVCNRKGEIVAQRKRTH